MITEIDGWKFKALVVSIIIAAAGYLGFSIWGGWQEVVDAFLKIGFLGTLIALLLSLVNYGLRFVRWQVYLGQLGHRIHWLPSLRIYLSGFALTTTPGKAGEVFRGVLLKQRGVPYPKTLAAFISERLSDLIAIVLLTLVGLSEYPEAKGMVIAGLIGIAIVLLSISSRTILDKTYSWVNMHVGKCYKLMSHVLELLSAARGCHTPRLIIFSTAISLIAWGTEALAFYWVLQWLEADISFSFAVFIYSLSMLVGGLSFLPGGLGSSEAVMISLLVLKGMAMPTAIAATVFIRLATLWFAVVIGLVAIYRSRHGERLAP
jgi:uncharacterized protein (TIRG00374 family)